MAKVLVSQHDSVERFDLADGVNMPVADWAAQIEAEIGEQAIGLNGIQFVEDPIHRYGKRVEEFVFIDVAPDIEDARALVERTVSFIAHLHEVRAKEQLAQLPALQ